MRCGGQRACNPSSAQKQFEHRFGANAALADRPGISAPGAEPPPEGAFVAAARWGSADPLEPALMT